jgi:hypothetical protein
MLLGGVKFVFVGTSYATLCVHCLREITADRSVAAGGTRSCHWSSKAQFAFCIESEEHRKAVTNVASFIAISTFRSRNRVTNHYATVSMQLGPFPR